MYIKDYIQATYETLHTNNDVERTLESLRSYLKRRGLDKFYAAILRGLIEKMRRSYKSATTHIRVARQSDFKKYEVEILKYLDTKGLSTDYEIHIDEKIIGGYSIESKNLQIDTSHKKQLLTAYQRLTATK